MVLILIILPVQLSSDTRSGVIRYWLMGNSRDEIASKFGISTGAVTNIVNEWRNKLGAYIIDDLRELSLSLKKADITSTECAIGFRVSKMMQKFGINEDQFEYFMTEVYNKCQILEIGPNQLGEYLTEIVNLSDSVFPSQIPNYINAKKREIENLKEQIENMQKTISDLYTKKINEEEELKSLLKTSNISREAIKWYEEIIKEVKDNGIPIDNPKFFIQCLKGIKNEGYDINKVIMRYSDSTYLSESIKIQEETKNQILQQIDKLQNIKKGLEEEISRDRLKSFKIKELESIGFGLKELRTIYNTIIEIAKDNDINYIEAIEKFFNDFNEYDNVIKFKKKVEDLRYELANLSIQITNNRKTLSSQQHIGTILQELLRIGISEKDIVDINSILSLERFNQYDNDNSNSKNSNNIIINKQSLISELTKYKNIKLVIKSLKQKRIQLSNNIQVLENQKIVLENYINHLFMILSNLKEIQILLKKANIALENPKSVLVCLFYIFLLKDNEKDNDSPN